MKYINYNRLLILYEETLESSLVFLLCPCSSFYLHYFIVSEVVIQCFAGKMDHYYYLEAHISHLFLYCRNQTCFGLSVEELLMLDTNACLVIEVASIRSLH